MRNSFRGEDGVTFLRSVTGTGIIIIFERIQLAYVQEEVKHGPKMVGCDDYHICVAGAGHNRRCISAVEFLVWLMSVR
jgi:hypothetical protein